jgi:hypothetical protein
MKYRITLKNGESYEFNSPFTPESLRKSMNLPTSTKIELVQPEEKVDDRQEDAPK